MDVTILWLICNVLFENNSKYLVVRNTATTDNMLSSMYRTYHLITVVDISTHSLQIVLSGFGRFYLHTFLLNQLQTITRVLPTYLHNKAIQVDVYALC